MNFMKNVKILIISSAIFALILGMFLASQFVFISDLFRGVISGLKHSINPPKISKDFEINNENFSNKIETNSFLIDIQNINGASIKYKDQKTHSKNQFVNSGLYAENINGITNLIYFTRNGFVVKNGKVNNYTLPKSYTPHNSKGGIRGVFYHEKKPFALMASKKIGCDYVSIVNLEKSREVFSTECLPETSKINYDGVGGASIHLRDKILLTIGTPANNSELIRDLAQNKASYFGKIIEIDKNDLDNLNYNKDNNLNVKIFSLGHRNPQGMAKINDNIFSSEHGPKGGDEVNYIQQNLNYGWPVSSYGTKYFLEPSDTYNKGDKLLKYYKNSHTKYGFEEPILQFTPSIGISSLTNCPEVLIKFYERKNCLLANSLREKSLYIIILDEMQPDKVIGYEKIKLDKRLRNFALNLDGTLFEENSKTIYISADDSSVLKLTFNTKKN